MAPQPLGYLASEEELREAEQRLLDAGYSPEEVAAWPRLPVTVPQDAIDVVAETLGDAPNLSYEASFDQRNNSYIVEVTSSPVSETGEPVPALGSTAVYEVGSDGTFERIA